MIKRIHLLILLCLCANTLLAQNEQVVGPPDEATHNATRYNFFLFNPAFSYNKEAAESRDKNGYVSFFGRVEKSDFENSPSNYRVAYNTSFKDKMGVGAALFQQNIGAISHFGAVLNYTYNVEFTRDVDVAFGANVKYQTSGLRSDIATQAPIANDPLLAGFDGISVLRLSPGVNLHYNEFDFGFTARNITSLVLGEDTSIYDTNTFVLHAMYSKPFARRSPNTFRGMLYAEKETANDPVFGFNTMVANEKYGFGQLGYNTNYGVSLGLGFNIKPFATIGYVVEKGFGSADVFGLTHEFTLAYNFIEPVRRNRSKAPQAPKSKRKLPERKELSRAEKIIALQEARDAQKEKLLALEETRSKAELLRTTASQEEEERLAASELVRTINSQIEGNDIEKAQATLTKIQNNKFISDDDKESILSRLTQKVQLAEDIETEQTRVAEATKEKNDARALLTRTSSLIASNDIAGSTASIERLMTSKYITDEEKQELQSSLNRIVEEKRVEDALVEENEAKERASSLVRLTNELLANNDIEEAQAKATLIRQNKFIPAAEKEQLLQRITKVVEEKEAATAVAAAETEERNRASSLVRLTNELLDNNDVEKAQAKATLIRQSKFIPDAEKEKLLSRLTRVVEEKEAADNLVAETNTLLDDENIADAQVKAELVRQSKFISEEEKTKILSRLERIVSTQVAVAEEENQGKVNSTLQRVVNSEVDETAQAEKLAEEARLAEEVRIAEQERQAAEAARLAEEARLAEQSRLAEEARLAEEVRLAEQERQAAEAARVAEESRLAEEARLAEAARVAEEDNRKKSELVRVTNTVIDSGNADEAKANMEIIRTSKLFKEEEKKQIISSLQKIVNQDIDRKAAEEEKARVAEEARIAEQARVAEEARLAEEARVAEQARLEEQARQAEQARIAEEARLAEAARLAEEARIAEQARIAEEARVAEQARVAEEARLAEEARIAEQARLEEEARQAEQARIAEEARLAEAARLAEEARIVEQARLDEQARLAEEARIAEQARLDQEARLAEEARVAEQARQAEQARIAEEARLAEEARVAEQARLAKQARLLEEARLAEERRLLQEAAKKAEAARLAEEERLLRESLKKKSTLTKTTTTVKDKSTPNAELTRVTKTVTEEQKQERRKAVQAQLKRTTKTINDDSSNGSGTTIRRANGSGSSKTNSNGMGFNEEKKEDSFKNDYFLKELYYQPSLKISNFGVLELINALVISNDNSSNKQNEKLIDLNKKKKKILRTRLKTVNKTE